MDRVTKGYLLGISVGLVASPIYLAFLDTHLSFLEWATAIVAGIFSFTLEKWAHIATAVGALATACALFVGFYQLRHTKALDHDRVLFDVVEKAYAEAYEYLIDEYEFPINSRQLWIRSARLLVQTQDIANQLKTRQFQQAEEIIRDRWRYRFYLLLQKDPDSENEGLRPQFYYGIDDWKDDDIDLDKAAELSGGHCVGKVGYRGVWDMPPAPELKILEPRSIDVICRFSLNLGRKGYAMDEMAYPELATWQKDLRGPFEGAAIFLEHDLLQIEKAEKLARESRENRSVRIKKPAATMLPGERNSAEVERAKKAAARRHRERI